MARSRWPQCAPIRRGRRRVSALGLLALTLALGSAPSAALAGQAATPGPTKARERPAVIASGEAELPVGGAVWRVTVDTIAAGKGRSGDDQAPGFFLVEEGTLLVAADGAAASEVGPGEAVFVPAGLRRWRAAGGAATTYYALEIIAPGVVQRSMPPSAEVLAVSAAFAVPLGTRFLGLLRGELARSEFAEATDIGAPALALTTTGRVTIRANDGTVGLRAGEATLVAGPFVVATGGCDDATFALAVAVPEGDAAPASGPAPVADPASADDGDADELADDAEPTVGTDPGVADTDGDGLCDGHEVNGYGHGTDPLAADTDGDGLADGEEVNDTGTEPLDPDSDDDGVEDGAE